MESTAERPPTLARRLRELREQRWPDVRITQRELAPALGVSVPSISSWEKAKAVPPVDRLAAYATFFATRRSIYGRPFSLVKEAELSDNERADRDRLRQELLALRGVDEPPGTSRVATETTERNPFHFPDGNRVTIVCSQVPREELQRRAPFVAANNPFSPDDPFSPENPDYTEMYTYADLDALVEVHGHLRAVNPTSEVNYRAASRQLAADRYTDHTVLLGGVDWNPATMDFLRVLDMPVSQQERDDDEPAGWFEVSNGERRRFHPRLETDERGRQLLVEDVAHFYQAPNPFNKERIVTICNGMFSRGVLGAVRALTDQRFRERNTTYLRKRFRAGVISILYRVRVNRGVVVTPDWTEPDTVLHEWPTDGSATG